MYKLSKEKTQDFLEEPEFGMGYQLASIKLDSNPPDEKWRDIIIFNAELIVEISELPTLLRRSIEFAPEEIVDHAKEISDFELKFYKPTDEAFLDKLTLKAPHIFRKLLIQKKFQQVRNLKDFQRLRMIKEL